MKFAEEKKRVI